VEGLKKHENPHGKIRAHLTMIFYKGKEGPSSVATHDSLGSIERLHVSVCKFSLLRDIHFKCTVLKLYKNSYKLYKTIQMQL